MMIENEYIQLGHRKMQLAACVNPYTGDGVRYLKKDHVANKEYRYGCSIDCGGTPMRVYERTLGSQGSWTSMEDYVSAPTFVWYNESSDYGWLPGQWLSALDPPGEGDMYYQDSFGVQVAGDFNPQAPAQPLPEYMKGDDSIRLRQHKPSDCFAICAASFLSGGVVSYLLCLSQCQNALQPQDHPSPPSFIGAIVIFPIEPLDLSQITEDAPFPWLKRLTREFVCDLNKPFLGIGRQHWCNGCQIKCAKSCGPEDVFENLGCIMACNARYLKCLASGKF